MEEPVWLVVTEHRQDERPSRPGLDLARNATRERTAAAVEPTLRRYSFGAQWG